MNVLKFILPIIVCLIAIPVVFAGNTETDYFFMEGTNEQVTGVQALFYTCLDYDCNAVSAPFSGFKIISGNYDSINKVLNSGSNNYVTVEYPGAANPTNYAEYFYKEGYIPLAFRVEGDYGTGLHFNYDNQFSKLENAHAPVGSFTVLNKVYQNEPLQINIEASLDAETRSAFSDAGIPPYYVPESFKDEFYSAETKVTLNIYKPGGVLAYTESKTISIYMDETENVGFTWTPTEAGAGYKAEIVTEVTDSKVSSTVKELTAKTFDVLPARPKDECYVILNELDVDEPFPLINRELTVTYTKISNYAASDYAKTAVPMEVTHEIKEGKHNPAGNVVYSETKELPATSTTVPAEQSFKWTPASTGWYTIYITGECKGIACEGKTSHEETISKEIYVRAVPAYDITFTVTDLHTSEPIKDAQVTIYMATAKTNINGVVVFKGFHSGDYSYTIEHPDYYSKQGTIKIGNVDLYVDVPLERKNIPSGNNAPEITSIPVTAATKGELYTYDVDASDKDGDVLTYLLMNNPDGMTINPTNGAVKWTPDSVGTYNVNVMVTDNKGGVDAQEFTITVQEETDGFVIDNSLRITKLRTSDEYIRAGDMLEISFDLENIGNKKLENIKITAMVPEFELRKSIGPFDLKKSEEITKHLFVEIPADVQAGNYYIRLTFNNDDIQRTEYREITII